tara:strand:+ start:73 stop:393 length:321 start_codon:yes stop_codon:yes gene_type:complete
MPHSHIIRWPIAFISLHFTPGNIARQVIPAPQQQVVGQPSPALNFAKNVVFSEKQQFFLRQAINSSQIGVFSVFFKKLRNWPRRAVKMAGFGGIHYLRRFYPILAR